jgi:hypothetical protein
MIIDRFEENFAVVETDSGEYINIERTALPEGARAGDVLIKSGGRYEVDNAATQSRKNRIREKQNLLWE